MLDTLYTLALLNTPRIGRKSAQSVLAAAQHPVSSASDLFALLNEARKENKHIVVPSFEQLEMAVDKACRIMDSCDRLDINIMTITSSEFPDLLRSIPDAPVILYVKGDSTCLFNKTAVAVVGTREPTSYGEERAARFGAVFAEKGLVVVSGLAKGCDTAAHRGCLSVQGQTVAVLAHGLDTIYPASNRALAAKILEMRGCWVSEYPPGVSVRKNYLVERDRLQSGLSSGVVVVETDVKGGTMHTVGFCLKQGRLLGCLAHPSEYEGNPKTFGNKKLLEQRKAIRLFSMADIESFIEKHYGSTGAKEGQSEEGPETSTGGNEATGNTNQTFQQTSFLNLIG